MTNNDNTIATIELQRFPHVGQQIFGYVRTPDLLQFRKVSETWKEIAEKVLVKRWKGNWSNIGLQLDFEALQENSDLRNSEDCLYYSYDIEHPNLRSLLEYQNANNIQDINEMMRRVNLAQIRKNPLLYACTFGKLQVVKLLLDFSTISDDIDLNVKMCWERSPNLRKDPGFTGLMLACLNGHLNVVEFLLDQSKTYNIALNARDTLQWTPLLHACRRGQTKVVELLLNHSRAEDINFNARNYQGETAFIVACFEGHIDIVRLLLDHSTVRSIDLTIRDYEGWNGFMWSCRTRQRWAIEVVRLLLDHPVMENFDLTIGSRGRRSGCSRQSGRTAFMLACHGGNFEVVKMLLDHSDSKEIGLNIRDDSGKTAFLIACSRDTCTKGIVQLLLDYSETKNIQLNVRDNNGMTGFMLSYQINILAAHLKRMRSQAAELILKNSDEKNIELPFDAHEYPERLASAIEEETSTQIELKQKWMEYTENRGRSS